MTLSVGSTFTGVGGADLGLEWAGFSIAWQCELDSWKRQVLAAHWPDVPIHDDITTLHDPPLVDLLVGGFPCQDLSIAGKRKGFNGERSVLAFEFLRLAESLQPRWLLLENVPGLLSSSGGADFARLLQEMGSIGYECAWRVLDARYFGVPQRRRRVFIVARRADAEFDPRGAARLALRALSEGSGGDPTPSWPPRQNATADAAGRAHNGSVGVNGDVSESVCNAVTRKWAKGTGGPAGDECQNLIAATLTSGSHPGSNMPGRRREDDINLVVNPVAYRKSRRAQTDQDDESWVEDGAANKLNRFDTGDTRTTHAVVDVASTLQRAGGERGQRIDAEGAAGGHLVPSPMSVRRLTPVECERLMGWPDNWTAPKGIKAPDSKRYAACGDGIVSWCAYWIGQRIRMIEEEA